MTWTKDRWDAFGSVNYVGPYNQLFASFSGVEEVDPFVTVDIGIGFEALDM